MINVIRGETKKLHLFIFAPKEKKSVLGLILKNLFFLVIGMGICFLTLNADNTALLRSIGDTVPVPMVNTANQTVNISNTSGEKPITNNYELKAGDTVSTNSSSDILITIPDNTILRLDRNTVLKAEDLDIDSKNYKFLLEKGNLWVNTKFDDIKLTINTNYLVLEPRKASFNINYDGNLTTIFAHSHDVSTKIFFNDMEINSFWLAEGNSIQAANSKIEQKYDTIKKLLYSKLTKEFNYGRVSQQSIDADAWLTKQINLDNEYAKTIQNDYFSEVRETGLNSVSIGSIRYQLKSFVLDLRKVLTVSETKKISHVLYSLFENLNDAKYLFIQNNNVDANIRLSIFKEDLIANEYAGNEYFTKELYSKLKSEFIKALIINPADSVYPVKIELLDEIIKSPYYKSAYPSIKFQFLTDRFNDVSEGVSINPDTSLEAFKTYFKNYRALVEQYKNNLDTISDEIKRQNIIVDNVLSKYPKLFNLEVIQNKKLMEEDYIAALKGENDKKEQRQTFISNKIDLLIKVKYFLFDNLISAEDARQIVFVLIEDIEEMKKETLDIAAVNELFDKRLSDFGIFWQYLNSPEYSTTPLHGATHDERYEAFKKVQAEIVSFQDVQNEILGSGEEEVTLTVEAILENAKKDLNAAKVLDVEFGFFNDISQTRIPVLKAKVSGIEFRATYDWDRKLLANIVVGEKLLTADGIKLENVQKFIVETISAQNTVITVETTSTSEETTQKDEQVELKNAARVFVAEKFSKTGMLITKESVTIVDFDNGEYEIKEVTYSDNEDAVFSFSYKSKEDKIYNLEIETDAGLKEVNDTFLSSFLKPVVLKIYEEAKIS
jgi:hypothetical protein